MNTKLLVSLLVISLPLLTPMESRAGYAFVAAREQLNLQKIGAMMEISWIQGNVNYTGLMVIKKEDGSGVFVVKFMHPGRGIVRVRQHAQLNNQYDMFGNCTSFIRCSNPSLAGYSPDNFLVNPNGTMMTMDDNGNYSTMIMASPIMPNFWKEKLLQYGLDSNLRDIDYDDNIISRGTPKYAMN